MKLKEVVYRELDSKLVKEWEVMWKSSDSANYFNSPFWFAAALKAFEYKDYVILSVYNGAHLAGIIPLVYQKRFGIGFYTVPADYTCGSPFLVANGERGVLASLARLVSSVGNVFLDEVSESAAQEISKIVKKSEAWACSDNYYLILDDKVVSRLKSSHSLSRARKYKHDLSELNFSGFSKKFMNWVFKIDDESPKRSGGYSTFVNHKMRVFYGELAKIMKGYYLTHILSFKGEPVAYSIGFVVNGVYYGNQMAYTRSSAHMSPGRVLLAGLAEWMYQNNIKFIDFGSGSSEYKRGITKEYKSLYKIVFSQNLLVRKYISCVSKLKLKLYLRLTSNKRMYVLYRKLMPWQA